MGVIRMSFYCLFGCRIV